MKRNWKKANEYKVYITTYDDDSYYIGRWSSNSKIEYSNYFGSNTTNKMVVGKKTIATYTNATSASLMECLLQLKHREDPKCLNKMINIRIRTDHIKDFPQFEIKF